MSPARALLMLAGLVAAWPAIAQIEPPKLSQMADVLQRLQAGVARGDRAAYQEQFKQLKAMGAAIAAAKPEAWKGRREADALVVYALSGGAIADIAPLLKDEAFAGDVGPTLRGAVAYITNHTAEAKELLGRIDLAALDLRLAGQVAFARSVLETKSDPKAATALLDWARLVAPGTLVEEAALRREISLLAEAGDAKRVALLTRQYATRFPASLYAADFFRELAGTIAGLADDPATHELMARAISGLPVESRTAFWLGVAKAATVAGRFAAASDAASSALKDARPDSSEEARARLYHSAGELLSGGYDSGLADLHGISQARLDRSDAALLAAVKSVAAELRTAPSAAAVDAQGAVAAGAKPEGAETTIQSAEEALKRTSSMVAGADP